MKITKEQKLHMAREHIEEGIPLSELEKKYNYSLSNVKYQCALHERYGPKAFENEKIRTYTRGEKLEAIKRNKAGTSMRQIALYD